MLVHYLVGFSIVISNQSKKSTKIAIIQYLNIELNLYHFIRAENFKLMIKVQDNHSKKG